MWEESLLRFSTGEGERKGGVSSEWGWKNEKQEDKEMCMQFRSRFALPLMYLLFLGTAELQKNKGHGEGLANDFHFLYK